MKIDEIKILLKSASLEDLPHMMAQFENDPRTGVIKLIDNYKKWHNKMCDERQRLENMLFFENKYASWGNVCGVDEVGAGPLAGPVAAGAVILPPGCIIDGLNDSKKLSAKKRNELYAVIKSVALACYVAFLDNGIIDEINILQARMRVMELAVKGLSICPDVVLVDGLFTPNISNKVVALGKDGDSRSMSVAAASVIAKVERDALMVQYHEQYPRYGFNRNMGYGTAEHMAAIQKYGSTPIHRRTFL